MNLIKSGMVFFRIQMAVMYFQLLVRYNFIYSNGKDFWLEVVFSDAFKDNLREARTFEQRSPGAL